MVSRTRKSRSQNLYGQYSAAAHRGDLAELVSLVSHPDTDIELLAVIAPSIRDKDADAQLIHHVLDHPACSGAIASRYATHHDADVRLRVATFPNIGSVLEMLAVDADDRVREAAAQRLDAMGDVLRPDRSV